MPNEVNQSKIYISRHALEDQKDLSKIKSALEKGKILFLDTKPIFNKYQNNVMILKQTIDELRQIVLRKGGNIGRIGETILVLSPQKKVKLKF